MAVGFVASVLALAAQQVTLAFVPAPWDWADEPLRVLMVSPAQYSQFATDPKFRQFQASALARANQAGGHPLFMGQAGLWNNTLIIKMPKPVSKTTAANNQ